MCFILSGRPRLQAVTVGFVIGTLLGSPWCPQSDCRVGEAASQVFPVKSSYSSPYRHLDCWDEDYVMPPHGVAICSLSPTQPVSLKVDTGGASIAAGPGSMVDVVHAPNGVVDEAILEAIAVHEAVRRSGGTYVLLRLTLDEQEQLSHARASGLELSVVQR